MKKFFEDFKAFISRGNVLDMAIGVIIAGAFGKISTSLVSDVLMPFLGFICGTRDMTALNIMIRPESVDAEGNVTQAITLGFGTLVGTVIDFLIIAFVVFLIVRAMARAQDFADKRKKKDETPAEPTTKVCPYCLSEIPIKATRCPHCTSELHEE